MSAYVRRPSLRTLDIYRLVVARGLKQIDVARSFGVSPAHVSQVIRRVRNWVSHHVGDWFMPREDALRFYVALHCDHIRVHEFPDHPESVRIAGNGWTYVRHDGEASELEDWSPLDSQREPVTPTENPPIQDPIHVCGQPVNSPHLPAFEPPAATLSEQTNCAPPGINDLAHRLAQLLTIWRKHRKLESPGR